MEIQFEKRKSFQLLFTFKTANLKQPNLMTYRKYTNFYKLQTIVEDMILLNKGLL